MKHQTPESMKFRRLQRRLGSSKSVTVGTLELLWIATQRNAPRGDIGRHSDEEIAIECDWDGDPGFLVCALVETGWLDRHDEHRLVVHDWADHAPRYVHGVAARKGGMIVADYSEGLQSPTTVDDCIGAQPNVTKRNLTKPNQTNVRTLGVRALDGDAYKRLTPRMETLKKTISPNPNRKLKPLDRELCVRAVCLEDAGYFDLDPIMESCRRKSPNTTSRWGYFKGAIRKACVAGGVDFDEVFNRIVVPDDLGVHDSAEEPGACAVGS